MCAAPFAAVWSEISGRYTRCRMHGSKSTEPRTPEGLERCRRANWKHGRFAAGGLWREWRKVHQLVRIHLGEKERTRKVLAPEARDWAEKMWPGITKDL
jgi:hypothetical protein